MATEKKDKEAKTPKKIQRAIIQPATKEAPAEYSPMLHGNATDAIATMSGRDVVKNPLNNTASITSNGVKAVMNQFSSIKGTLGVSTHKLLSKAITNFTALNHTAGKRELRNLRVSIPLKEYALLCGYDVLERETTNEEDALKEHNRAESALKNARRKIKKDLDLLYNTSISWSEKVKGRCEDFTNIRLVSMVRIKQGYITIEFSQSMGEYLIQLPLTQYPDALYRIDERKGNAYSIGLKMVEHYSMDNNQTQNTAQLLKVQTLLNYTSLPTPEQLAKYRLDWEQRIKEPFEVALDALTRCGLLENWEYSHSKGIPLTDDEATSFPGYEEWANTLVHFTLKDAPDHTLRLQAKAEAKEKNQAKKKSN